MESAFRKNHMVGIVPLSPHHKNLGMPWPDYLLYLDDDFCLLKNSVYECLFAGCDSIWVVCNDDTLPLVRNVLGDYARAPDHYFDPSGRNYPNSYEKNIPIFYTPLSQGDRNRESLGWSVIAGALTSFKVCSRISKWTRPSKYYVSFPYSVYDIGVLSKNKDKIRSSDLCFLSCNNKTVKSGHQLGFSFSPRHWITFKRNVKQDCSGGNKNLPLEKRWSSANFSLDKIFNCDNIEEVQDTIETTGYLNFDTWNSVREFYQSSLDLVRPEIEMIGPFFR